MQFVLDLNGTLMHVSSKPIPGLEPDAQTRSKYIYLRPFAFEFLRTLLMEGHLIGVWTSCVQRNAKEVVAATFPEDIRNSLCFLLSRESCIRLQGRGYRTIKDLNLIWSKHGWIPEKTFAIDDTEEKFCRQPNKLIKVREFRADRPDWRDDGELRKLLRIIRKSCEKNVYRWDSPSRDLPPPVFHRINVQHPHRLPERHHPPGFRREGRSQQSIFPSSAVRTCPQKDTTVQDREGQVQHFLRREDESSTQSSRNTDRSLVGL